MKNNLVRFDIRGLYGVRDYSILINNNKLILIGENGSGKTTILKIVYYTLSCNWDALVQYSFDDISLVFSDDYQIQIEARFLKGIYKLNNIERINMVYSNSNINELSTPLLNRIVDMKLSYDSKQDLQLNLVKGFRYPNEFFDVILMSPDISKLKDLTIAIQDRLDSQILYLPTYRRIEEQLRNIFPDIDSRNWEKARKKRNSDRAIELIEFGMNDVIEAVNQRLDEIKEFSQVKQNQLTLGYLGEIVEAKYNKVTIQKIRDLSDDEINDVLQHIDTDILSDEQKQSIQSVITSVRNGTKGTRAAQTKIICHYFLKLLDFRNQVKLEEQSLRKFAEKCNKYLVCNRIGYDSKSFKCNIYNLVGSENQNSDCNITFQDMSSGEKQIVSLFSHLNLIQKRKVLVFIDEPELSLSVDWQKTFLLDILDSINCDGLIAATHSPFIFQNELDGYVHGVNEFCTRG